MFLLSVERTIYRMICKYKEIFFFSLSITHSHTKLNAKNCTNNNMTGKDENGSIPNDVKCLFSDVKTHRPTKSRPNIIITYELWNCISHKIRVHNYFFWFWYAPTFLARILYWQIFVLHLRCTKSNTEKPCKLILSISHSHTHVLCFFFLTHLIAYVINQFEIGTMYCKIISFVTRFDFRLDFLWVYHLNWHLIWRSTLSHVFSLNTFGF